MSAQKKVLIVEDDLLFRDSLRQILTLEGYKVQTAQNSDSAFRMVRDFNPRLILLDICLNDSSFDGLEIFSQLRKSLDFTASVIVITADSSRDSWNTAMALGAYTFISKNSANSMDKILADAHQAIVHAEHNQQLQLMRKENKILRSQLKSGLSLLGDSPEIRSIRRNLLRAHEKKADLLLVGETGTGRHTVTQWYYHLQDRSTTFKSISLGEAKTGDLDFLSRTYDKKSPRGFIHLDDMHLMSRPLQDKLANYLGQGKPASRPYTIICTAEPDWQSNLAEGDFNPDLIPMLEASRINLPPLRKRGQDAILLTQAFLNEYCDMYQVKNASRPETLQSLYKQYEWPGNVQELKSMCEEAVTSASPVTNEVITALLDDKIRKLRRIKDSDELYQLLQNDSYHECMDEWEKRYLLHQLRRYSFKVSVTAKAIGLERSTLYKKCKKFGFTELLS